MNASDVLVAALLMAPGISAWVNMLAVRKENLESARTHDKLLDRINSLEPLREQVAQAHKLAAGQDADVKRALAVCKELRDSVSDLQSRLMSRSL